jgi:hypothetical protein
MDSKGFLELSCRFWSKFTAEHFTAGSGVLETYFGSAQNTNAEPF